MGRCSNVSWPAIFLVTAIASLFMLMVWFIRCLVRLGDSSQSPDEEVWGWDWYDVAAGLSLFILAALVGVLVSCRGHARELLVSSDPKVLSAPHPRHITPVRMWTPQITKIEPRVTAAARVQIVTPERMAKLAPAPRQVPRNPYSPLW